MNIYAKNRREKKFVVVICILLFCSFQAISQNFTEKKIALSIRVWGLLKYYSPVVYNTRLNWDNILTEKYMSIVMAGNTDEFNHAIAGMIDTVYEKTQIKIRYSQSIENSIRENRISEITNFTFLEDTQRYIVRVDFSWIVSNSLLNNINKAKLLEILINYRPRGRSKYLTNNKSGIVKPNEDLYQDVTIWDGKVLTVPEEYRFLAFARFWNIINYLYPYKNILDVSWDYFLESEGWYFIKNKYYYGALQTIISHLCDGHAVTNFKQIKVPDNGSASIKLNNKYYLPFGIKYIDTKAYISQFIDSLKYLKGGILKGDRLVEINGQNVDSSFSANCPYFSTGNASALKSKIEQQFTFRKYNDSIINVKIQRGSSTIAVDVMGITDEQHENLISKHAEYTIINDSTVYINIGAPSEVFYKCLNNSIEKNIILDMRFYPEGVNIFYLNAFINCDKTSISNYYYPNHSYPGVFIKNIEPINYYVDFRKIPKAYKHGLEFFGGNEILTNTFKKKMVVLIDGSTISQSETVCMMIKTCYSQALFIGRQTAGCDGDVVDEIYLPGGVSFRYTSIDFHFADGRPIQRVGIIPDIIINDSKDFLDKSNDIILDRAVEIINSTSYKSLE